MSACYVCDKVLLPQYGALFGALLVGVEAAAYLSLTLITLLLTLAAFLRVVRWLSR